MQLWVILRTAIRLVNVSLHALLPHITDVYLTQEHHYDRKYNVLFKNYEAFFFNPFYVSEKGFSKIFLLAKRNIFCFSKIDV